MASVSLPALQIVTARCVERFVARLTNCKRKIA